MEWRAIKDDLSLTKKMGHVKSELQTNPKGMLLMWNTRSYKYPFAGSSPAHSFYYHNSSYNAKRCEQGMKNEQ